MDRIGYVATCQRGLTGLVLSMARVVDWGKVTIIYRGVCLDAGRVGSKWESRDPKWVGTLDEWAVLRVLLIEANEKE